MNAMLSGGSNDLFGGDVLSQRVVAFSERCDIKVRPQQMPQFLPRPSPCNC